MRTCLFIALLCYSSYTSAQLSIGDTVPDIEFEYVLNHERQNMRLSDFQDKVVILDFWATWCTSCLHSFPKLDSLQRLYGSDLQIILVNSKKTRDDEKKVESFLSHWKAQHKTFRLPIVVNDSIADATFPHRLLPHYVWIGKGGKLVATTSSAAVTAEAVRQVMAGGSPFQDMKIDQDAERPLFTTRDLPYSDVEHFALLVRGQYAGLPGGERTRYRNGVAVGKAFTNFPLVTMYQKLAVLLDSSVLGKRFLVEGIDSSVLFPPSDYHKREVWYADHLYSLDVIVPEDSSDRLIEHILGSLNGYSPYYGRFELRRLRCLVLERADEFDPVKPTGGRMENWLFGKTKSYLKNGTTEVLVRSLNRLKFLIYPVVDGTRYDGLINVNFKGLPERLEDLQEQLGNNGYRLTMSEKVLKVFVLRKK